MKELIKNLRTSGIARHIFFHPFHQQWYMSFHYHDWIECNCGKRFHS